MNADQTIPIRLVCWSCGVFKDVLVVEPPTFGFQLAGFAQDVGMVGYADHRYSRVLIFCNEEHAKAQMTKKGSFRLRPATLPLQARGARL